MSLLREHWLIYDLFAGVNSTEIAVNMWSGSRSDESRVDGAKRVIACLNACAGISTEELERPGLLVNMPSDHNIIAQRGKLLALAMRVSGLNADAGEIGPGMLASLVEEARAVIAEVEGKK